MTEASRELTEPAASREGGGGLVRLRLDLGYDGTEFAGWATQPGQRTVQEVLEDALRIVLRLPRPGGLRVVCAGRTDAGVHARGQVVHLDIPASSYDGDARMLGRRLSGVLPADVALRAAGVAPDGFDARFSPLWRRYSYRISEHPLGAEALRRRDVLDHRRVLDLGAVQTAAGTLLGERDFAAFCRRRVGATTVRTLHELSFVRAAGDQDGGLVVGRVVADAFCHSMVRALMGALLSVGDGRRAADWPARVLDGRDRRPDVTVAPARALTLEEVRYPGEAEMAARAAATRRRRGTDTS